MKKIALIAVSLMLVAASADAAVWRVRQGRHWDAQYNTMIDYIEPAAKAANAAFGGTEANDTWNCWDVDTRYGELSGYNYINGVAIDRTGGLSTLKSGDLASSVTITSLANNDQHSPWYGLPTSGSGFNQLLGSDHSAGTNGTGAGKTYTLEISGLTPGALAFYSYAQNVGPRGDIDPGYGIALNGGAVTTVNHSAYAEGDAASGVLLNATVGIDGKLTIVYTNAGFTGPAFQFATVPEPATLSLLVLGGIATLIRRRNRRA